MPSDIVVKGVMLIFLVTFIVFVLEFFLPLSAKIDMNIYCRATLVMMDTKGGLSDTDKSELINRLEGRGFTNVAVTGTDYAPQGTYVVLNVSCDYTYSKLVGLLTRGNLTQNMVYNKTSIARKVVN